jgi:hypothetical protein
MFVVPCVLIFALTASTVFAYTPVRVFGQADMQSFAANRGGAASAETLNYPLGSDLDADGGYYLADRNNHRVLYFANDGDSVADRVYGQHGDFSAHISNNDGTGNSGAPSADNLSMPTAVSLDSTGGLYVTDRDNHRVLYFANDGNTTADRVYGQYGNFGTNMVNNNGSVVYGEPGPDNFSTYILGVAVDSQDGIYVSDTANHRILYFANDGNTTADRVYGQWDNMNWGVRNNDGAGNIGAPSANSLNFPRGVTVDASDGLYIADRDNNRVLYFANDGDTTADRVYGQYGNFASNVESNDGGGNVGAPTPDNLSHPKDMSVGPNGGLYVADSFHNRVLYFASDGDTTADGNSADFGAELHEPGGIVVLPNGEFYVSDTLNNRALYIQCPDWGG